MFLLIVSQAPLFCKPRGKIVARSAACTGVQGLSRPGFTDTRRHAPTNERDLSAPDARDDSVPHIAWGKYTEEGGRLTLGISIEVNHRLIDGLHIGRFFAELTRLPERDIHSVDDIR